MGKTFSALSEKSPSQPLDNSAIFAIEENGNTYKLTKAALFNYISQQYGTDINSFLLSQDKRQARNAISIDRRKTFSDANYTINVDDKVVSQIGNMSSPRTLTLPSANLFRAGGELIIFDESGTVDSTNKITVQRAGTDTIDGLTSLEITSAYGILKLICNGSDGWKIDSKGYPAQASFDLQGVNIPYKNIEVQMASVDPATDVSFGTGVAQFEDGTRKKFTSQIGQLDVSFGTGSGMLRSGLTKTGNTTYHLFIISNPTTGDIKPFADTSFASPQLPAGYTKKMYSHSVLTDVNGNIFPFYNIGNFNSWLTYHVDHSGISGWANRAVKSPVGFHHLVELDVYGNESRLRLSPFFNSAYYYEVGAQATGSYGDEYCSYNIPTRVKTNDLAQVHCAGSSRQYGQYPSFKTLGWFNPYYKS